MTRSGSTALGVLMLALAASACGSSGQSHGTTVAGGHAQGIRFANCMRAHGVPDFPDPSGGGGGINLLRTSINPQSPAFKSSQRACARLLPGKPGGTTATESEFLAALRFAKCMRLHGFPSFPDPTRVDAPPGPILIVGHGFFFHVSPSFDPNTPAVTRAVAACGGGRS